MAQMSIPQALDLAHQQYAQGLLPQAESICRQILAAQTDQPDALHLLGAIVAQMGSLDAGINFIQRAIAINPSAAAYHNSLGQMLVRAGSNAQAIDAFRRAVQLAPDFVDAHYNLAMALQAALRWTEAVEVNQRVISLQPNHAPAYNNLGLSLHAVGRFEEAIVAYERALSLSPNKALVHYNFAMTLLLSGDLSRGFSEYEWRCREPMLRMCRDYPRPRWDGSDLQGKRILLHSEQGLGDTIQFIRYAPMIRARGGEVLLECQPAVVNLLRNIDGLAAVVPNDGPLPQFDVHCPLLSLPFIFGSTLDSIPSGVPYLRADAAQSEKWKSRLASIPGKKVGLVWAGSSEYANDSARSIDPNLLATLAEVRGVHLISLQKNASANPVATDWTAELNDFTDTAALIESLDLVISVDTAVAHLAGAMGKSVWIMLPSVPDWRWLLNRNDTPWYPTAKLFRQTTPGHWPAVIAQVAAALDQFASA